MTNRNSPQKHVWRARILLLTADGLGTNAIMRGTGRAKSVVWRWQERFMREGVDGLLRDKTRPPGRKPLDPGIIERVVATTTKAPPGETTHWTAGLMAKAVGISISSVQRIWQAHGLHPHRVRRFKLSKDPEFVPKLREIVGLYVNPPAHAIVLSIDEKSQIQALDRTQPGLPMKKGRAGTLTHDCATTIVMSGWRQLGWPVCDCREGAAIGKRQLAATITPVLPRRPWRQWREPSGGGSFRH